MSRKRLIAVVSCPLAFLIALATPASALINLEWRPDTQTVSVGATVEIGLYAVSDDPEIDQYILAMDVILNWDADFLELIGVDDTGPYEWLFSGFPVGDVDGLNDTFADGDALYTALGQLGAGAWATPEGLLVTTFQFTALAETPGTSLTIAEDAGLYTHTAVWGSPGLDVHGSLGSATVTIGTCGDLDGDLDVDCDDLEILLAALGSAEGDPDYNPDADLDGDGFITLVDYQIWMECYLTFLDFVYAFFYDCMAGPGAEPDPPSGDSQECLYYFDADDDTDVDLIDFLRLQTMPVCLGG